MPAILAIPAGMIVGSFATVVAYRVPRRRSFVGGRSACPECGTTIAAYDNVPVLSWLMLRGRCRNCGAHISARYPLTELGMAILFAISVLVLGTDDLGELALGLVLCALLVTVTLTDLERRVIPNRCASCRRSDRRGDGRRSATRAASWSAGSPGSLREAPSC